MPHLKSLQLSEPKKPLQIQPAHSELQIIYNKLGDVFFVLKMPPKQINETSKCVRDG